MTARLEQNLDGHSIRDLRTEFAQKQRSASRHCDEEYEPSCEDPRWPPIAANGHVQRILTYFNEVWEETWIYKRSRNI